MGTTELVTLLVGAFVVTLLLWTLASLVAIGNRWLFDRREAQLIGIARELADPAVAGLAPSRQPPALRRFLAWRTRASIYWMIGGDECSPRVADACATHAIDRWGLAQVRQDAACTRRRAKWRRIAALFALGHIRDPGVYPLLAAASIDADPELADAAGVVLARLGDRRAAELLVMALREGTCSRARTAARLDRYPISVGDLVLPLLEDGQAHVRFWGATLAARYLTTPGASALVASLRHDTEAVVRRAAMDTLRSGNDGAAASVARHLLDDPVSFVRAAAVRALAAQAVAAGTMEARRPCAELLCHRLEDPAWDVRLAAKEGLEQLGPGVWREVATSLDSADAFARNGAAEVLQNLGLLDDMLAEWHSGLEPSDEEFDLLQRAFREGGQPMIDAARGRLGGGVGT